MKEGRVTITSQHCLLFCFYVMLNKIVETVNKEGCMMGGQEAM